MSARFVFGFALAIATSCCGVSQLASTGNDAGITARAAGGSRGPFKQELMRRIAVEEAAVRQAEAAHATDVELGRAYWRLGLSCEDAAELGRAEAAFGRSESLFRRVANDGSELATALDSMGILHAAQGKMREAEKEERESLGLREKLGNRLQMAKSWNTLAGLLLAQHKFDKAKDFAQKAAEEFMANDQANPSDRASSRYALAMALCWLKDCPSAVPLLKAAVSDAKVTMSAHDWPVGYGEFLLGFAYWKSGDIQNAGIEMQTGVADMREQLGWGHPSYLAVLRLYDKYLHETRNVEVANEVERQIHQAEAVVDVGSLQSGQTALGFDGLR